MQKQSLFLSAGLTIITSLTSLSLNLSPSFSQSTNTSSQPNRVTFFCREIIDQSSGERIPATVAWIPERKGHIRFIGWKSDYFNKGGWSPKERCERVTQKFQEFYNAGRLNFLTHGKHNGYGIICGLAKQGEDCNNATQLFTVRAGSNPNQVLQRLTAILESKSSQILYQSTGQRSHVNVQNFLSNSPLVEIK
jgi:hypothetical protein